jgi:hypothetical protein
MLSVSKEAHILVNNHKTEPIETVDCLALWEPTMHSRIQSWNHSRGTSWNSRRKRQSYFAKIFTLLFHLLHLQSRSTPASHSRFSFPQGPTWFRQLKYFHICHQTRFKSLFRYLIDSLWSYRSRSWDSNGQKIYSNHIPLSGRENGMLSSHHISMSHRMTSNIWTKCRRQSSHDKPKRLMVFKLSPRTGR